MNDIAMPVGGRGGEFDKPGYKPFSSMKDALDDANQQRLDSRFE